MTIGTIFERYEVPEAVATEALRRGAFVLALQDAWVGPEVQWQLLVKALVFASLGEQGGHIRKKVGLDKYIVTLITRGVPKFAHTVATSLDWHQKLYTYCLWRETAEELGVDSREWENIQNQVEHNLMHTVDLGTPDPATLNTIRGMEIYHYKNPSV